jgi:hypothetical protein
MSVFRKYEYNRLQSRANLLINYFLFQSRRRLFPINFGAVKILRIRQDAKESHPSGRSSPVGISRWLLRALDLGAVAVQTGCGRFPG